MESARIMVVEDENIVAMDIRSGLRGLGYSVPAVACTGEEAIRKAAETRPDLALMDVVLKGRMDGIEAAEEIRRRLDIPVVYLTAYGDDRTLQRAKATEPFGYLLKPFHDRELRGAIELALYKNRMERKLKESQSWLSTTLMSIGDGVIATDARGLVAFMNSVSESLTGWRQEEAAGKPLKEIFCLVDEETRAPLEDPAALVLGEGAAPASGSEALLAARDGASVAVEQRGAPIRDASGRILGVVLVFRDISERKRAEEKIRRGLEEVEKANKIQSEFLSIMSHELKTPINVVMGYAGMLRDQILPSQDKALGKIAKYSQDLLAMVNSILEATRIEAGAISVAHKRVDLRVFMEELRSGYDFPLDKDVRLDWRQPDALPAIRTDAVKLKHVLENLINNAIKFTPAGTVTVSVGVARAERFVEFRVTDTGIGIPPEKLSTIFEKFRQVDSSETRPYGGVGLGLYIVKRFTELLGGRIEVESRPGKGTSFALALPLAADEPRG